MPLATTRWSVVLAAREDTPEGRKALADLCESYWYPLYAFARRRGASEHDACEQTQGFFADLLAKDLVSKADPTRGRFRSFVFTSFKNYLSNQARAARAIKRGGEVRVVSFEAGEAEERYRREPATDLTPERLFERRWALTLLEQVLASLREDYRRKGKSELFERIEPSLLGEKGERYAEIAADLGMPVGTIKINVHRLRQRFRERLRQAIADTVRPEDFVDELRHFVEVISSTC